MTKQKRHVLLARTRAERQQPDKVRTRRLVLRLVVLFPPVLLVPGAKQVTKNTGKGRKRQKGGRKKKQTKDERRRRIGLQKKKGRNGRKKKKRRARKTSQTPLAHVAKNKGLEHADNSPVRLGRNLRGCDRGRKQRGISETHTGNNDQGARNTKENRPTGHVMWPSALSWFE